VIAVIPFETGSSKVTYPPLQNCSADAGTGWRAHCQQCSSQCQPYTIPMDLAANLAPSLSTFFSET